MSFQNALPGLENVGWTIVDQYIDEQGWEVTVTEPIGWTGPTVCECLPWEECRCSPKATPAKFRYEPSSDGGVNMGGRGGLSVR